MGNIDSTMSLVCVHHVATVCKGALQSNSVPLSFEVAHFSRSCGDSQPCQWAVYCNVPVKDETFSSGQMAFGQLPIVHSCNFSIVAVIT